MRPRGVGVVLLALIVLSAALVWWSRSGRTAAPPANEVAAELRADAGVARLARAAEDASVALLDPVAVDGVLEVHVTGEAGPVAGAQLTLSRRRPLNSGWSQSWEPPVLQRTDAQGVAAIPSAPGSFILSVAHEPFAIATLDLVKPAGERVTVVHVRLERGFELLGQALDVKDRAVAPATIRATPLGDRSTRRRQSPSGVVETAVDARGLFRFEHLAAGWWRLEGEAEGTGRAEAALVNLPSNEVVKLRFRSSGFLEGVVVQPDGGVAPHALVVVVGGEGTESLEAGATGTFSLERMPGPYRVSAWHEERVGSAKEVALVRAGATTQTRITLSGKGGVIEGTVKRDDGEPVAGARVTTSPHNEDGTSGQATSAADGTWSIRGFPRGTYDVEAEASGLMRAEETGFFVDDGAVAHVELVLGRLGRVTGKVQTPTGGPLSMRVALRSQRNAFPERQAVSDAAGQFTFEDVPPGDAFVRAMRSPEELSRAANVKVLPGATSEVKVIWFDPIALEVELDRTRCTPPSEVVLVAMEPGSSQKRVQRLAPLGSARLTFQLSPGTWQLLGWDAKMNNCTLTGRMKTVTLEAGQKPAPVRLTFGPSEENFVVVVHEADGEPAPYATVTVREDQGGLSVASADADGVAKVGFPADAAVTVSASLQGRSAQVKGVRRSAGRVVLTLSPAARIHLRLEGAKGTTRVEAMLEDEAFGDEVRVSGAAGWIDEVPAGMVVLNATNEAQKSRGTTRVLTRSGQVTEASIQLQNAGQVHGSVKLPAGTQGAWVSLTSPLSSEREVVAPDGTFSFEAVLPGEYVAKVECAACGGLLPKPAKVAPGSTVALQFP